MSGWLGRFFGSEKEDRGESPSDREAESTGPGAGARPVGQSKAPGGAGRGDNDRTVRIDAKSSSRLAWPARDDQPQAAAPVRPGRVQEASFDPHEEPTRLVRSDRARSDQTDGDPFGAARSRPQENPSMSRRPPSSARSAPPNDAVDEEDEQPDDTTRLVSSPSARRDDDPVVGWLVVIKGPGRGRSMEIGSGANPIGRAPGQKLCLNFGDPRISRERHAVIVYDPVSRRFFLQAGAGRNLTYLGDQVVLEPKEMKPGDTLTVGDTVLHFIPYCGADFGWS
jgi:FHA domain-containing protein